MDLGVVLGVLGGEGIPEHVRDLIRRAHVVEEQAARELVEDVAVLGEHLLASDRRLLEELLTGEDLTLERLGVLGHPLGVVPAARRGELLGVVRRVRDWHRGVHRVEVDRADVELELRLQLLEVEARHRR